MASPSRIVITGISGFVGGHLAYRCLTSYPSARVYGIVRMDQHQSRTVAGLEPIVADMRNAQSVREMIARTRPELVFHLAAQSSVALSWTNPIETMRTNVEGTLHLLEAIHAEQLRSRILIVGSSEEYGTVTPEENPVSEEHALHPLNPYAVSKVTQELFAYQYFVAQHLPIICARPFTHFGPGQAEQFVVSSIAHQIALIEAGRAEPVLKVGNTEAQRDFLAVMDMVDAYLALAERGCAGEAYNIGSGQAHSIAEIVQFFVRQISRPIDVQVDPARYRPLDHAVLLADSTKLRTHTGWQPRIGFQQALLDTLDWWREKIRIPQSIKTQNYIK